MQVELAFTSGNGPHDIVERVGRFIYAMTSVSIPMPHQTPLV